MKKWGVRISEVPYSDDIPGPRDFYFHPIGDRALFTTEDRACPATWASCSKEIDREEFMPLVTLTIKSSTEGSAFRLVEAIMGGKLIVFEGNLQYISDLLERVRRILSDMELANEEFWQCFFRCTIALERGQLKHIDDIELPYWPEDWDSIVNESLHRLTLIPAFLVCWICGENVFRWIFPLREKTPLFVDEATILYERYIGCNLGIEPKVYVPDERVVELLGSVYYSSGSPLLSDIHDRVVFEPCTGTGVLAIALAKLGASKVLSTDIHPGSVRCARKNITRLQMEDKIQVEKKSGLPRHGIANVVLVNPPWFSRVTSSQIRASEHYRRCSVDIDHNLLRSLLVEAKVRTFNTASFYVFLGSHDPFDTTIEMPNEVRIDYRRIGWDITDVWHGYGNVRLYRFIKVPLT